MIRKIIKKQQFVPYTKIREIKDARKCFGVSTKYVPDVSMWPEDMREHKIIEYDVQLVNRAINGRWKPNWKNKKQRKYYPWWWIDEVQEGVMSGRGLSLSDVLCDHSCTDVGPRLVFQSDKKVQHFVKYFKPLMEKYYFID